MLSTSSEESVEVLRGEGTTQEVEVRPIPERSITSRDRRLAFIDVLRGFACLWVTLCHAHAHWLGLYKSQPGDGLLLSSVMRFVGIGGRGVDLFVVISGFCLIYPVLERRLNNKPALSLGQFYKRRAFRIFPTYVSAIVFALVLLHVPGLVVIAPFTGWSDVLPYLLLIQNHMPDSLARINGTLWSVAMEAQLYVLFPLLAWLLAWKGKWGVVGVGAGVSLLTGVAISQGWTRGWWLDPATQTGMPWHLVQFSVGMAVAAAVLSPKKIYTAIAGVACVVLLPLCLLTMTRNSPSWLVPLGTACWGGFFGAVLYLSWRLELRGWANVLPARVLAGVGLISFSVYVVHFPIVLVTEPYAKQFFSNPLVGLGFFMVTGLPLILGVGGVLFLIVERHSLPAVRRRQRGGKAETTAPTVAAR